MAEPPTGFSQRFGFATQSLSEEEVAERATRTGVGTLDPNVAEPIPMWA